MSSRSTLAVALLLVLAGCSSGAAPATGGAETATTTTPAATATGNAGPTDGDRAETAADGGAVTNPWGEETLTVVVANDASPWRNVTGIVATALRYWERNDGRYAPYQVDYTLQPDARNPDVVVRYVDEVGPCAGTSSTESVGYAPQVGRDETPPRPATVCIRAGYTDLTTLTVVKHEFGHLLGIGHDDPPQPLMRTNRERTTLPQPSESFRRFAWLEPNVSVYANYSGIYARREYRARRQLAHVTEYYDRTGSAVLGRTVSMSLTDNRTRADVVVRFPRQSQCPTPNWGSCGTVVRGPDGEPQIQLTLTNAHEEAVGWHVGYWLGFTFDPTHRSQLPHPFRNTTYHDRRAAWWR